MSPEEEKIDDLGPMDKDTTEEFIEMDKKNAGEKEEKVEEKEEKVEKKDEKSDITPKNEPEKSDITPKNEPEDKTIDDAVEDALKEDDAEEAKALESNIEFSEDSILSDEVREGFIKLDNSAEIDDEIVEKFGGLLEMATQDGYNHVIEAFKEQQKARRDAMNASPLLNEENKATTSKNIEAAVKRFGGDNTDDLMKFFNSHHSYDPHLLSFLNKVGAAVSEKPELGGKTVPAKGKESSADTELARAKKENAAFFT